MKRRTITGSAAAAVAVGTLTFGALPVAADDGGRPFTTPLTGAAERPMAGDLDGSGTATLRLNPGQREVCYTIEVKDVVALFAAHIHVGTADVAGPVVVPLPVGATGGAGCVTADRDLIRAIVRIPSNYYVNVHNADFPAGALRGQLG